MAEFRLFGCVVFEGITGETFSLGHHHSVSQKPSLELAEQCCYPRREFVLDAFDEELFRSWPNSDANDTEVLITQQGTDV